VTADQIREKYLSFFEERGHKRMPSASLVPSSYDPSVLLTTAGMQPFKPYFRGEEQPPAQRLTSCQKCFRTSDIDVVGTTKRHLTFFEMLGNFSIGDYFKQGAVEYATEFSTQHLGLDFERIWVTVFGGDEDLGLGPDDEAIACWKSVGVPDDRIVLLGREDNFWQAGPTGPCGPCSELYYDRGPDFGGDDERPGDDTDRVVEYWNLVFMQYELHDDGHLTPLPAKNIDTGLGLERMAAILQDVASVFEAEHFRPMVELGEELSGRKYGEDDRVTRALRILADHGRGMTFLLSDGVVPSNEERGYVLRRIMRRAVQQGQVLGIEQSFLPQLAECVIATMASAYPELEQNADTIKRWAASEEESFRHTLEQGERLLAEIVRRAREAGTSWIEAEDAFKLHDTFGFPYELTKELLAEDGLAVDDQGFEELMEQARDVARRGQRKTGDQGHERVVRFARGAGFATRFVGYEALESETTVGAVEQVNGKVLAKLSESPFYPEGGGQVSDSGVIETPSATARVLDVYRLGDDQALALELESGELVPGESAKAQVDRELRLATMCNHTATHLLHAALRQRLGTHVRQAGSYVGPDKLRFDFTHGERLSTADAAAVEELVNSWIVHSHPVFAVQTTREQAESLGAMALFGEKYGDVVRMVEIEEVSRELCGGTHVGSTAEIGLFHLTGESSSAANVRRIEAVTGPAGLELFRRRTEELRALASMLRVPEDQVQVAVSKLQEQVKALRKAEPSAKLDADVANRLAEAASEIGGVKVVVAPVEGVDQRGLNALADAVRQKLGDAAVVLGTASEGRVFLVANFAPAPVERGLKAGAIVKAAAEVAGGGGGGRDNLAQAGGKDAEKLPEALATARVAIEHALA
jgi:alanyl-tRNA synthetase